MFENIKRSFSFSGRLNLKEFSLAYFYGLFILYVSKHLILRTFLTLINVYAPNEFITQIYQFSDLINILAGPIGFSIFSYFLLVISRKRSRDMNADVLLSFIFFVPLSIFSLIVLIYLGFFTAPIWIAWFWRGLTSWFFDQLVI